MKRFRVKAVGLGLALVAAAAAASEGDRHVTGHPPPARRAAPAPTSTGGETIWVSARPPVTQFHVKPAGASEPVPVGPRPNGSGPGALPDIPVAPPLPATPQARPAVRQPDPIPPPRPVEVQPKPKSDDPPLMPQPQAPDFLPLPFPQPLPDTGSELPPAPPEWMCPVGVVQVGGKHSTFGSPPLRISRDFPRLLDLIGKGHDHDGITIAEEDGGAAGRFFASAEYLQWWLPGFPTPVLATTNPNLALNGFLGEPGTAAIVGPGPFIDSTRSGFRVRAGAWLDDCASCGIDGSFFFLGSRSNTVVVTSDRFPVITRPVFVPNLVPGTNMPLGENGEAVAVPGILRGALTVSGDSRFWGADVNARKNISCACDVRAEVFAGYRHLNLRESLTFVENISVIGAGGMRIGMLDPVGTQVVVRDSFATRNYFHGGQVGMLYGRSFGRWDADARASVALGGTHQVLEIDGSQLRQRPGMPPMNFRGGLLAAGPNLGRFTRDRFSVVPEFTLNFGYRVTGGLRVFAGYNFLFWSNVIRPGDQIDRVVDLSFVPNAPPAPPSGMNRPRPLFTQRDLVVNGIQFGLDWRW